MPASLPEPAREYLGGSNAVLGALTQSEDCACHNSLVDIGPRPARQKGICFDFALTSR